MPSMSKISMSVAVAVACVATKAIGNPVPVQGRALLRQQSTKVSMEIEIAQSAATSRVEGKRSKKLIERVFERESFRKGFDITLIEKALSGPGDTLDAEQTKDLKRALNLVEDPEDTESGPGGMSDWIKTELLPQAELTKKEMQSEVDRAQKAVRECQKLNWGAKRSMEHREKLLASDEAEKYKCLAEEHQLHLASASNCRDADHFAKDLNQPGTLTETDHTDRGAVKTVLRENFNFFNNAYDQFKELYAACAAAMQSVDGQDQQCDADAEVVAEFYCHMKMGRDQACDDYSGCYDAKKAIFNRVVEHVKAMETENMAHFRKLACSAFNSESIENEVHPDCASSVNTMHLEVSYPEVGDHHGDCIEMVKTRQNYTGINCNADGSVDHSMDVDESDESEEGAEGSDEAAEDTEEAAEGGAEAGSEAGNATAATAASGNGTAASGEAAAASDNSTASADAPAADP